MIAWHSRMSGDLELVICTNSPQMMQVRRQFQERPGIMTYAEKPDYARCVSIVATSALKVTHP